LYELQKPKRDELVRGWRIWHNEELHNWNTCPNIIIIIKPMRMRWAGHVTCVARRGMRKGFLWERQKERDQ
jgi:hypothetical protein